MQGSGRAHPRERETFWSKAAYDSLPISNRRVWLVTRLHIRGRTPVVSDEASELLLHSLHLFTKDPSPAPYCGLSLHIKAARRLHAQLAEGCETK
eukprot:4594463-Pyramimonas_sp.AAC.1